MGHNEYGQLGLGDKYERLLPTKIPNIKALSVSCGGFHTIIIDLDNNVWTMGKNDNGQLGLGDRENRLSPTLISNIKALNISCGREHTAVIVI
jgi:alpha-tubulin suppressor-like RCC1 family protein